MNKEIDSKKYELISQIRSGSFGAYNIAKSILNDQLFYAKVSFSKVIFESDGPDRKSRSSKEYAERLFAFVCEVEIHSQLFHPCIIRYNGYSKTDFHGDPYPVIFTEYPVCGTLSDVLYKKNNKNGGLSKTLKYICVYGIAAAMEFLHKKKIIHFNLNPDNILMDEQKLPKISEFSSSQQGTINKDNVKFDSLLYTAPELFDDEPIDEKVDVYSFGIILNEIYSKKQPYYGFKNPFLLQSKIANNNYRPDIISKTSASQFKSLIVRCWHKDPKERPSFSEILEILKGDALLNNKKLEVNKDDFFSYVEYIDSAVKAYESNPDQTISIFDFIKDKAKSEIKLAEINVDADRRRNARRFTLYSSKSKPYIGAYESTPKKKAPLIDDHSEASNVDDESSKKSDTEQSENSDVKSKSGKKDKGKKDDKKGKDDKKSDKKDKKGKKDKPDKSDKSDTITVTKVYDRKHPSLFPSTLYFTLKPKCQQIVNAADNNDRHLLKKLTASLIEGTNDFPQNIGIAVSYLKEGIKNGNADSMFQLAELYQKGEFLPRNLEKSVSLYKQILSQKESKSHNLAAKVNLYTIQLSYDPEAAKLFDDQVDEQKVRETYKESADKGIVESMVLYAKHCMVERGKIHRNLEETVKYLKLAIKSGSGEAMAIYGQICQHGYGIEEPSKDEAKKLYKKSYEKDSKEGEAYFGYLKVEQKEKDGLKMIVSSKEEENPIGINAYGLLVFNGLCDFMPDEERGAYYIKIAADAGYPNAMHNYARCLELGRGVKKDAPQAVEYYKKALSEGCLFSSLNLGVLLTRGDKESNLEANVQDGIKYIQMASEYKISVDDQEQLNLIM